MSGILWKKGQFLKYIGYKRKIWLSRDQYLCQLYSQYVNQCDKIRFLLTDSIEHLQKWNPVYSNVPVSQIFQQNLNRAQATQYCFQNLVCQGWSISSPHGVSWIKWFRQWLSILFM